MLYLSVTGSERPLRQHAHLLRIAVGDVEREVGERQAGLVRVVALQVEGLRLEAQVRDRVIGVGGRLRNVESERPVPHELSLHERLVVREHESAVRAALRQLGRPRERPVLHMGEIGRLAVRDVENVGRDTRMEVLDRRVVEVPRQSEVDRVVCRRCPDLPPLGIEQPLAGGVVVDVEDEIDAVVQTRDRLRLGLGLLGRAAIRIAGFDSGGAFVVVVPVLRVVPVRIDAVADLGRPVAVVIPQVLPPQPRVGALRTCTGTHPGSRRARTRTRSPSAGP